MKGMVLLALALIAVTFARTVSAQTSTWELSLHGSAMRHDVFDEDDMAFGLGGKLARYAAGGWGLGAKLDYFDGGAQTLKTGAIDVRFLHYAAEVDKSLPTRGRTRFTVGTGIGGATAFYDGVPGVGDRRETNLMVPISAGLKFMNRSTAPSWGLNVGVRDQMVFQGDTHPLGTFRDSDVAHHVQGTVGLSFFFGGDGKRVSVAKEATPRATPTPAPADKPSNTEARKRVLAEIREKVFFDFDRSEIKSEGRETLRRKAEAMRALPEVEIKIEGHADERGTVEYNLALGERRAKAAFDYLVGLGIDPQRMSIVSYGEEYPALEGRGETVWSQNRRAEFVPSIH